MDANQAKNSNPLDENTFPNPYSTQEDVHLREIRTDSDDQNYDQHHPNSESMQEKSLIADEEGFSQIGSPEMKKSFTQHLGSSTDSFDNFDQVLDDQANQSNSTLHLPVDQFKTISSSTSTSANNPRPTLHRSLTNASIDLFGSLPASNTSETVNRLLNKGQYQSVSSSPGLPGTISGSTGYSTSSSSKRALSQKPSTVFMGDFRPLHSDHTLNSEKYFPSYRHSFHNGPEDDDKLHDPGPKKDGHHIDDDHSGHIFTIRGLLNVGTLIIFASALLMLFAGYPILAFIMGHGEGTKGGYNIGGTNATGQIPFLVNLPSLIDKDTPTDAFTRLSLDGSKKMKLVFSDEFNKDGRSFYPGDDPFWEAVDLHYWGTANYEWYDPVAVTTENGNLVITFSESPEHNLNFRGGMITTWNKMCFTGGYIEVSVILPGSPDISGLWPAAWTMGNLGRAGYGATTDGMWPYSYDECDVGTLANQTWPANMGGGPVAAETTGVYTDQYGPALSYLPGQRLSRCTCPSFKDHPGPKHPDGSWVGRSAPEIDIIEAQASTNRGQPGHVSMSMQVAPYDSGYNMTTASGAYEFYNPDAILNTYTGSVYQQAASGLITTDSNTYEDSGNQYAQYGFEYKPGGPPDAYVTWTKGGQPMWRLNAMGIGPNSATEIGQRIIPPEPMYVLLNLGMSSSFTWVDFDHLHFPAKFYVDYVRIWQPEDEENIGCDPPDFPTFDYINNHKEAYFNQNLTIWEGDAALGGFGQQKPPNRLIDQC